MTSGTAATCDAMTRKPRRSAGLGGTKLAGMGGNVTGGGGATASSALTEPVELAELPDPLAGAGAAGVGEAAAGAGAGAAGVGGAVGGGVAGCDVVGTTTVAVTVARWATD